VNEIYWRNSGFFFNKKGMEFLALSWQQFITSADDTHEVDSY
jgi:hypothetical protein